MISKRRATLFTLILNLGFSLVTMLTGLIFTRFILRTYGSSVNGLILSLNQFISLFSIVEGGITTAAIVAIYKQYANSDNEKLNNILFTAKKTYFRIGLYISVFLLFFGSIYINFLDSDFPYRIMFMMLFIGTLQLVLSLTFESRYSILFSGSNQEYKAVMIRTVSRLIGWGMSIYLIMSGRHILFVYSTFLITTILNIIILKMLILKDIPQATYNGEYDPSLIKGSRDVLSQKIASVIFHSTDLILISTMINLQMASVYAVYNMIYRAISTIVVSISQAPANSFGHLVSKDENNIRVAEFFSIYETVILVTSSIFMLVTSILIIPFITIYTSGIEDVVYVDNNISIMFFTMFYLAMINKSYGNIINVTGKFYLQNRPMLMASIINILLSVLGALNFGIYGILLGSIVGFLIIVIYNMINSYKYILKQNFTESIFRVTLNYLFCVIIMRVCTEVIPRLDNYLELIIVATIVFILVSIAIVTMNLLFWRIKMRNAYIFFKSSLESKKSKQM